MFDQNIIEDVLGIFFSNNKKFRGHNSPEWFEGHLNQQTPRVTLVACCDSRVHLHSIHCSPVNDAFIVRNIGNQLSTSLGSIDYGVNNLKTPLLVIKGHSRCGAVQGACSNDINSNTAVGKELSTLSINAKDDINQAILENIHNQVDFAKRRYLDKLHNNELAILGLLYDFANDYGSGYGSLLLVNFNGDTDPINLSERFSTVIGLKTYSL